MRWMESLNFKITMKKIFLILMAGAGLAVIFSCNRENDLGDDNVTTKGTLGK